MIGYLDIGALQHRNGPQSANTGYLDIGALQHRSRLRIVSRVQGGASASATSVDSPVQAHSAGGLLVVLLTWSDSAPTISTVTDLAGNAYEQAGTTVTQEGNKYAIYFKANCLGHAANVVTVAWSGSVAYRSIVVLEIAGDFSNTGSALTDTATGTAIGGTSIASGTLTLADDEEIIVAIMVASPTITGAGGFSLTNFAVTGDASKYFADEYQIVTVDMAAQATISLSAAWGILAASFREPGAAPFFGAVMARWRAWR